MAKPTVEELLLHREIEEFLYAEADLLDFRQFKDWIKLFTEDVRYWMPIAQNIPISRVNKDEYSDEESGSAWINEGKEILEKRVAQLATGIHWSEEPRSRVSHIVTNIRIIEMDGELPSPLSVKVRSRFLIYRNRMEAEETTLVGKREDVLRSTDDGWRIARRTIYLDQNVLLSKNLSIFL